MKDLKCVLVGLLILVGSGGLATASQEAVGARPAAMSGAYVGVVDDGYSLYWNPAGMAFLDHHELTWMYSNLFGLEINNNYAAYIYPVTEHTAVGIDWFNVGFDDFELEYSFNKFNLGAAYKLHKKASIGFSLKHLNTSTSFDNRSMGKGSGWARDAGALVKLTEKLSLGLVVNNLFNAYIKYDNGTKARLYDAEVRAGLGYKPLDDILIAADVGNRFHLGGEYLYRDLLALRAGVQRDLEGEKETVLSFGLGFKYKPIQIDYSLVNYSYLDNTSMISLSIFFDFNRSQARLKNIKPIGEQGLYPSLWSVYESAPFLEFEVENRSDGPLKCDWEVELEDMMGASPRGEIILRPKEERKIYVTGKFSERFYSNPSDAFKTGKLKLKYQDKREVKTVGGDFQAFIFQKGAIDWSADENWVACFVNPQDREIRDFAVKLIDRNARYADYSGALANVHYAMAVFNSLRHYGLKYLPDPNRPYSTIAESGYSIDDIQFPIEVLNSKSGDCDDLSVLLCTMFEALGIETVMLDVPGHIFIMFDTGIPSIYKITLMLPDELIADYDGRIFIPLEVTEIAAGFMEAWKYGAIEYHRWKNMGELQHISLREGWSKYRPVPLSLEIEEKEFAADSLPDEMKASVAELTELNQTFVNNRYHARIASISGRADSLNLQALKMIFDGEHAGAMELLKEAYALDRSHVGILGNLANLHALNGEYAEAAGIYDRMDKLGLTDWKSLHNSIITQYVMRREDTTADSRGLIAFVTERIATLEWPSSYEGQFDDLVECIENEYLDAEPFVGCVGSVLRGAGPEEVKARIETGIKSGRPKDKEGWFLWYGLDQ